MGCGAKLFDGVESVWDKGKYGVRNEVTGCQGRMSHREVGEIQ